MVSLEPRKKDKNKSKFVKPGPIYSEDGIPYDYIIIIDSGSKGLRVFVYNWLNPAAALNKTLDMSVVLKKPNLNLIKRYSVALSLIHI